MGLDAVTLAAAKKAAKKMVDGAGAIAGKSAYEIAVDNGFTGSETEWLESLQGTDGAPGADGQDGADGKSAYAIAVENGFEGTEEQWLASLHGADGQDGSNGTDGTDGTDGKSAYELAVDSGYSGTEEQWLASLHGTNGTNGTNGTDGESAYEIAVDNGFVGTEQQWLASLKGDPGDDGADFIAPTEDSSTASAPYAVGDQLIYNGVLYDVTAPIAANDTLTVGTNIAAADKVTEQIKDINTNVGDLSDLNTTAKSNLVAAINETVQSGGGGGSTSIMQGATATANGRAGSAPQPLIADRNKALFGDGHYHAVSTGSKSAVIAILPTSYAGETVTLSDGATTLSGTVGNDGEYVFDNLTLWGPVTLSCTKSGTTIKGFANLISYGNYIVYLTTDYASITITTSNSSLYGNNVMLSTEGLYGAIEYLGVFDNNGTAIVYVDKLARYYIKTYDASGELYRSYVLVTEFGDNYNTSIANYEVYGYIVDLNNSDPEACMSVPQDCDNYDYTNARMNYTLGEFYYGSWTGNEFFFPKPCMLKYDGTVDYYLDPDDYTKKADGTASDVANTSYGGNAMMEFPTIYFKRETDTTNNIVTVHISNKKIDSEYHAYAHHDKNGNVLDNIYIACYEMGHDGSKGRSLSGLSIYNNHSRVAEVDAAKACNTSGEKGEGWYTWHKADWDMVRDLCILISGSLDSQNSFGNGKVSDSFVTSGTLDDKGLFSGDDALNQTVKVFGIENVWGNYWMALAGVVSDGSLHWKTKMTYGTEDGSTIQGFNFDGSGYKQFAGNNLSSNDSVVKKWCTTEDGFTPLEGNANTSTYTCDQFVYAANAYPLLGGDNSYALKGGISCFYMSSSPSTSYPNSSAALTYKGKASL